MKKLLSILFVAIFLFAGAYAESATATLQELYAQAELLMVQGDYTGAATKFEALGAYSDASQMTMYCKAVAAAESFGMYSLAADAFNDLGDFKDSKQMSKYYAARACEFAGTIDVASASDSELSIALGCNETAEDIYGGLAFFKDSLTRMAACSTRIKEIKSERSRRLSAEREETYQNALALEQSGDYAEAIKLYQTIKGYRDSTVRISICETAILDSKYDAAIALMNTGKYSEAVSAFNEIVTHKDSAVQIQACEAAILDEKYDEAMALLNNGKYSEAIAAFTELKTHKDSTAQIAVCEAALLDEKYKAATELMNAEKYTDAYTAFIELNGYKDSTEKAEFLRDQFQNERLAQATVGSYVTFGSYNQDNNPNNGHEEIEWLVLEKQNNRLLLISLHALDAKPYNKELKDVTWETCTLRTWLNKDFLTAAFNSKEQKKIPTVTVSANKESGLKTNPGKSTQDKVFLLSYEESRKYFPTDASRCCTSTPYAREQGKLTTGRIIYGYGQNPTCRWWLRSPSYSQSSAALVEIDGNLNNAGCGVNGSICAVRPALWIEIPQ